MIKGKRMKKYLIVTSTASMVYRFLLDNISFMLDKGYEINVATNFIEGSNCSDENIQMLKKILTQKGIKYFQIDFCRDVKHLIKNWKAYKQLVDVVLNNNYDFINCHTPIGGVEARFAAHKCNVPVIYMAHGFHFFDGCPRKNWILYYPVEKYLSKYTDLLITINTDDYKLAKYRFQMKDLVYCPGIGYKKKKIEHLLVDKKAKLKSLELPVDSIKVLSVGELNKNKNHKLIIKTLAEIKDRKWDYVVVGNGSLMNELSHLAKKLNVSENVHLLGYRDDVLEILEVCDIYVLPSLREGLNVSIMEAMGSGLPCVAANIRGNNDLLGKDSEFLVKSNSLSEFKSAIIKLMDDEELRKSEGLENIKRVSNFNIPTVNNTIYKAFKLLEKKLD